ncbi:NADH-quinone oxidoreductase subunit 15 [Deinococcus wulumuqiensis]|uniref:NADH dehydrogenase n=1 Tax=Deinococcus wulumuqiensis TaxID=980427 RepID=A0AAV4K736_9DEIO|nr:NADH-quinone oxidoreductase subunit 15 [Deinococcus wulumuqiensis]QII20779.1 NADH-quinone oxidoreductase subunit 15 [Deinococcus wulumuqiensis R12]GGI69457.1 NADH dehydrogenase [Deinococcus wulumuqiensis]GGI80075.1 NADH dehydrogenase [Deinococcus wulumuqiensis]
MANSDKAALYRQWVELLGWLEQEAAVRGLSTEKVADFPDYIYRMERPYDLPTTVMSVSVGRGGQALLVAAVSPRHVDLGGVSLRLMGGSKHWHLHAGEGGLLEGKRPFTRERLGALLDGALQGRSTLAV